MDCIYHRRVLIVSAKLHCEHVGNMFPTCCQQVVDVAQHVRTRLNCCTTSCWHESWLKMAEEEDEQIFILACSCIIFSSVLVNYAVQNRKRRHSVWVRGYLRPKERTRHGAYNCLMKNLRLHDTDKLRNYLRMKLPVFEELFGKVEPLITSRSTRFR